MNFQLSTFNIQLYCKDHLGNNRLSYTLDPETNQIKILEENHYYPFGLKHGAYNQTRKGVKYKEQLPTKKEVKQVMPEEVKFKYKYNGKEWQDELGLNWYDYGARNYQADLGRWLNVDPFAEEYVNLTLYAYCANNSIVFIDQDGNRLFFVGGANNDQDGWNYITRWGNFMTNAGIRNFVRVNASNGKSGDILFTSNYRNTGTYYEYILKKDPGGGLYKEYTGRELPREHNAIDRAIEQIKKNIIENPLEEEEQFNLAGYSYGSVLQAQVALRLANEGQYIDNLILIGSPISDDSKLMRQLKDNKNIGKVIRYDIKGDLLSNPKDILEFIRGGYQNSSDNGPHFDLARPGAQTDRLIQTVIKWLQEQGVK